LALWTMSHRDSACGAIFNGMLALILH